MFRRKKDAEELSCGFEVKYTRVIPFRRRLVERCLYEDFPVLSVSEMVHDEVRHPDAKSQSDEQGCKDH